MLFATLFDRDLFSEATAMTTIQWLSLRCTAMHFHLVAIIRRLLTASMAFMAPFAIISSLMLYQEPAIAMVGNPYISTTALATMSNRTDAAAKNAEGRLESSYGEISGDTGHQIKGKSKQVQASAMNVAEDVKDGARSVGKKIADATGQK
jgi:uncharacterized protein YjbJ (UPF0337 family)